MELLAVVNEKDEMIGKATKKDIYDRLLGHRVSQVMVFNSKGEMLLQLRAKKKFGYPEHWAPSAGGHVASSESYEETAAREMEEEIGIKGDLELLWKEPFEGSWEGSPILKHIAFYRAEHDGPFRAEPSEIEKVQFLGLDEIKRMISRGEKMHPELLFFLEKQYGIGTEK